MKSIAKDSIESSCVIVTEKFRSRTGAKVPAYPGAAAVVQASPVSPIKLPLSLLCCMQRSEVSHGVAIRLNGS